MSFYNKGWLTFDVANINVLFRLISIQIVCCVETHAIAVSVEHLVIDVEMRHSLEIKQVLRNNWPLIVSIHALMYWFLNVDGAFMIKMFSTEKTELLSHPNCFWCEDLFCKYLNVCMSQLHIYCIFAYELINIVTAA